MRPRWLRVVARFLLWCVYLVCVPLLLRAAVAVVCDGFVTALLGATATLAVVGLVADIVLTRKRSAAGDVASSLSSYVGRRMVVPMVVPLVLGGRPYPCVVLYDAVLAVTVAAGVVLEIVGWYRSRRPRFLPTVVGDIAIVLAGLVALRFYLRGPLFAGLVRGFG